MELVLCCDMVVAARTASFGLPEVKRGLLPDFGGAFRASRALPVNVARELLLTGQYLGAERAERLGFVNVLTEPGGALAAALTLAETVCANARWPSGRRWVSSPTSERRRDRQLARSDAAHARLLTTTTCRKASAPSSNDEHRTGSTTEARVGENPATRAHGSCSSGRLGGDPSIPRC